MSSNDVNNDDGPTPNLDLLLEVQAKTAKFQTEPTQPSAARPVSEFQDAFLPLMESNDIALYELNLAEKRPSSDLLSRVFDALKRNTYLHTLVLRGNSLDDKDLEGLIEALRVNRGLVKLDLSANENITDAFADHLVDVLQASNNTLCEVLLDATQVSDELGSEIAYLMLLNKFPAEFKPLVYRTRQNDESLFEFELNYDPSDVKVYNEESTQLIVEAFRTNNTIRALKLSRCCRSEYCIAVLAQLLAESPTIERVALRENMLGDEACRLLVDGMKRNAKLPIVDIDLARNEIGNRGFDYITRFLDDNDTIRNINVEFNPATPEALNRLRRGTALNCEPSVLKPLVPKLLGNSPLLTELDLVGQEEDERAGPGRGRFTNLGAATISRAMRMNTHITKINLSNNLIGPDGAKAIGDLLKENATITSVDLSHNPIQDEGLRHLITAMNSNENVVELNVKECNVTPVNVEELRSICHLNLQPLPIKHALANSDGYVPVLDLRRQDSQPLGKLAACNDESIQYIAAIVEKNMKVTEVDLTDCPIGDSGVAHVAELLKKPKCPLVKVSLCNVKMTDHGVRLLTAAVRCNHVVRVIHTSGNLETTNRPQGVLTDALSLNQYPVAVKEVVPLLHANVGGIVQINFPRNDPRQPAFDDDTARILFGALVDNTHVKKVVLSGHKLSNRAVGYACECLVENKHIQYIDMSNNQIGPDGAASLAEVLELTNTLKTLLLKKNNIMEMGAVKLVKALKMSCRTLTELDIDENNANDKTVQEAYSLVAFNDEPIEFRRAVLERVSSITSIAFVGDSYNGYLTDRSCRALQLALRTQRNVITSLSLEDHHITNVGLRLLFTILAEFKNITNVSVKGNRNIRAGIDEELEKFVTENTQILSFDLTGTQLPEETISRVELIMKLNAQSAKFRNYYYAVEKRQANPKAAKPVTLELPRYQLNSASMPLLVSLHGPEELKRIELINLAHNDIHDDGFVALIQALRPHATEHGSALKALYFDFNKLGSKGAVALSELMWECTSVVMVSLTKNPVTIGADSTPEGSTAVDGIATKVAANRKLLADETALRILHRDINAAAGTAVSAVRVSERRRQFAESEFATFEDTDILDEALKEAPKRQKYVRGMFRKSHTGSVPSTQEGATENQ